MALACTDPEYGHLGDALEAYEAGRSAMAAGAPEQAASDFARAETADPSSALLVAWSARALRAAGRQGAAQSKLNAGILRFPEASWLRYDRAALRALERDLGGAADDLRWLYANELANPIEVAEDPDFVALRTDPTLRALVPAAQVEASVEVEASSVLVGERYVLNFRITSRTGATIELESLGKGQSPLLVERIVEDVLESGPIWSRRWVRAEVRAVQPGRTVVGPWLVSAGGTTTITERVIIDAVSIEGRVFEPPDFMNSLALVLPGTRWADIEQPFLGEQPDGNWAVFPSKMGFRPRAQRLGPLMEFRRAGQPQWKALRVSGEPGAEIWSEGAVVAHQD